MSATRIRQSFHHMYSDFFCVIFKEHAPVNEVALRFYARLQWHCGGAAAQFREDRECVSCSLPSLQEDGPAATADHSLGRAGSGPMSGRD